jgi:SsrA-binding protein
MAKPARSAPKSAGKPGTAPAATKLIVDNRKARFRFDLLEKFEAGIALTGTEVKSLRAGKINLGDGYCRIEDNGEMFLHDVHISPYTHAGYTQHEPLRPRKLLLHKKEIQRLFQRVREKGLTLVPVRLYFKRGRVKAEIALAKGKTLYDKRETIKKRDQAREARQSQTGFA